MDLKNIDIAELIKEPSLITTDSRDLAGKKYFICFAGKNFDAHDFVEDLVKSDLEYIFVEKDLSLESEKLVKVEKTLDFYHKLAHEYRKQVDPKVIAITGSAGKTTTKNLLKTVFETKFKTHATEANYNNEYGVPKTILSMPKDTEVLICEMGMRGLGQIDLLTKTAEPDLAGVTCIGTAHIELLGSRDKIRQAKLEIINGFNPEASSNKLYVNQELYDFLTANQDYSDLLEKKNSELKVFTSYHYGSNPKFLISEGLLQDMDLVRNMALDSGMTEEEISHALENFEPSQGRGNFIYKEFLGDMKHIIFIDETYNSNIEAVRNSVKALKQIFQEDKKIVVLGKIGESDELQVEKLFQRYNQDPSIDLVDIRDLDHDEAKYLIDPLLEDNCVVFFKASRSEKLEELIALF